MGSLRFRKQFKLAPGLKFTVNKKSLGLTTGVRGANLTFNTKGRRTASVGLPGTGLWYRDTKTVGSSRTAAGHNKPMPDAHLAGRDELYAMLLAIGDQEALEAKAWLDTNTQAAHADDEWMGELYEWAGADPARRAKAREMVIAHLRQWVQRVVDMGQRNRYVQLYAETQKDVNFEALADEAQRQADAQLASSAEGVMLPEFDLPPMPSVVAPTTPARGFFSGFRHRR